MTETKKKTQPKRKTGSKALVGDKRASNKMTNAELAVVVRKLEYKIEMLRKLLVYFHGDHNIEIAERIITGEEFV